MSLVLRLGEILNNLKLKNKIEVREDELKKVVARLMGKHEVDYYSIEPIRENGELRGFIVRLSVYDDFLEGMRELIGRVKGEKVYLEVLFEPIEEKGSIDEELSWKARDLGVAYNVLKQPDKYILVLGREPLIINHPTCNRKMIYHYLVVER